MAKFLSNIDLVKNEIQNAVIQVLATAPASPKEGQIYYNSRDKYIYRYDGTSWAPIGVVYSQASSTGAVVTGLDKDGSVTTTKVVDITLSDYDPVSGGYVSADMTLEAALRALDQAVKNAVAGGGEINQNAWSSIGVKKQSTSSGAVAGQAADETLSAESKTDTFTVASGNKWVDINGSGKQLNIGHSLSGAEAGSYGDGAHVAKITVDEAGHVTEAEEVAIAFPEVDVPEYTIAKLATATAGYLASYQLEKDGVKVGEVINIPKDYLVKSAEIKESAGADDPSGFPAGTKYVDFVVNTASGTGTESHIYLNVQELVDAYTAGDGIDISSTNVISVKVVEANGLSVDGSGVKMGVASASANGAMSKDDFSKLSGIDAGATKNAITMNGAAAKNPTFYAPTSGGTSGQHLVSNGSGAPTWQDMPTILKKYTATNGALTASGGAWTWTITFATHGVSTPAIIQVYEVASGGVVLTDAGISASGDIVIGINDTEGAGTLAAGTYRVVIIG